MKTINRQAIQLFSQYASCWEGLPNLTCFISHLLQLLQQMLVKQIGLTSLNQRVYQAVNSNYNCKQLIVIDSFEGNNCNCFRCSNNSESTVFTCYNKTSNDILHGTYIIVNMSIQFIWDCTQPQTALITHRKNDVS